MTTAREYQAVTTDEGVDLLVAKLLADNRMVAFDIETGYSSAKPAEKRALDTYHPDFFVVGFSITNDESWARYIPLRHDSERPLDPKRTWEAFRPVLEKLPVLAHNFQFELRALKQLAVQGDADAPIIPTIMHDSMLLSHVRGRNRFHGLKALSKEELGVDQTEFKTLFRDQVDQAGKKIPAKNARFNTLGLTQEVIEYACDDAALCLELFKKMWPDLDAGQQRIYKIEMEICRLMSEAGEFGIGVDWAGIRQAHGQYKGFRDNFDVVVREAFAAKSVDPEVKEFARTANFGSPVQMRSLLYDKLGMTTTRTTTTGALSTDAIALEALSRKEPAIRLLLSLREIDNLGRRCDKWLKEYYGSRDLRIHPTFSQSQVVSGRFSANDPAVQQLPKDWLWSVEWDDNGDYRTDGENGHDYWKGNFRKFICAQDDHYLLTFDYSQQELRVLAGLTGEPALLKGFAEGLDPHKLTASLMFNKPIDEVTKEERQAGKGIGFGILYGMGPKRLSEQLAVDKDEATRLFNLYKSQFTKVAQWDSTSRELGLARHYVTTWLGRKVPLWQSYDEDSYVRSGAERLAVNAQIQGGAADYTKLAMLRSWAMLRKAGLWGQNKVMLTMNQHDSLTFECHNSVDPNTVRVILQEAVVFDVRTMFPSLEGVLAFPTFEVDWELGRTWGGSAGWDMSTKAVWSEEAQTWHVEGTEPEEPVVFEERQEKISEPDMPVLPEITLSDVADDEVTEPVTPAQPEVFVIRPAVVTKKTLSDLLSRLAQHTGPHKVVLRIQDKLVPMTCSVSEEACSPIALTLVTGEGTTVEMVSEDELGIELG